LPRSRAVADEVSPAATRPGVQAVVLAARGHARRGGPALEGL